MKFCSYHWGHMENELRRRGLGHLISEPAEAQRRSAAGEPDAMAVALLALTQNILPYSPNMLFSEACPVCDLDIDQWIMICADDVAEFFRYHGMLKN